jgi:hypothetical protein
MLHKKNEMASYLNMRGVPVKEISQTEAHTGLLFDDEINTEGDEEGTYRSH